MSDHTPTCSACAAPLRAQSKICLFCGHFQGSRGFRTGDQEPASTRSRVLNFKIIDILWAPTEAAPVLAQTTPWWLILLLAIAVCGAPLMVILAFPEDMVQRLVVLRTGSLAEDLLMTLTIDVIRAFAWAPFFWFFARSLGGRADLGEITKTGTLACLPFILLFVAAALALLLRHPDCRSFIHRIGLRGLMIYFVFLLPITVWSCYLWYLATRAICRFGHSKMILSTVLALAAWLFADVFLPVSDYRGFELRDTFTPRDYYEEITPTRPTRWRSI